VAASGFHAGESVWRHSGLCREKKELQGYQHELAAICDKFEHDLFQISPTKRTSRAGAPLGREGDLPTNRMGRFLAAKASWQCDPIFRGLLATMAFFI